MATTDTVAYLPFINARRKAEPLTPLDVIECAACPTYFQIYKGFAFEAQNNGELLIGFFCSSQCFLRVIPVNCCGRA